MSSDDGSSTAPSRAMICAPEVRFTIVKSASAPHSLGSVARHLAWPPPPHSSENRILVPVLLNVAECQYEKFESETAATRTGCAGSRMSSRKPYPSHAPP